MSVPVYTGEMDRSSDSFTSAWEKVVPSGSSATMKYGDNTSWIDEHYTHTYNTTSPHTATVGNNKGYYNEVGKTKNWAKIEITHKGSFSVYKMTW